MSSVLALALKRMALSHGTVPSAVPVGQAIPSGTNGPLGTNGPPGTLGTLLDASLDGDPLDSAVIEERAALAALSVQPCYLEGWARLQCQRPSYAIEEAWRQAIEDAGRFLDAWGADSETMQWTASELFDVPNEGRPGGLIWQIKGERVDALGEHCARLADGRTILRSEIRGRK
jgi:hypothetical protein